MRSHQLSGFSHLLVSLSSAVPVARWLYRFGRQNVGHVRCSVAAAEIPLFGIMQHRSPAEIICRHIRWMHGPIDELHQSIFRSRFHGHPSTASPERLAIFLDHAEAAFDFFVAGPNFRCRPQLEDTKLRREGIAPRDLKPVTAADDADQVGMRDLDMVYKRRVSTRLVSKSPDASFIASFLQTQHD